MATDKKHIAVYLDPAVEAALVTFCQQRGLISKKGTMYSAGVNASLAAFFGVADIDNILQSNGNIPAKASTIPNDTGNTPSEAPTVEVMPGKSEGLSDVGHESLKQELEALRAENQRLQNDLGNSQSELTEVRSQLETLKGENEALRNAQPAAKFELPEAPDLLNQLKAQRKKATASLADVEKILEIIGD
jgi:hypothetical protein